MIRTWEDLKRHAERVRDTRRKGPSISVLVSMGTCGIAAGTQPVLDAIRKTVAERGLGEKIEVVSTGCMGLCHGEPSIEVIDRINDRDFIYGQVTPQQAPALLDIGPEPSKGLQALPRAWYYPDDDEQSNGRPQARLILRNCGRIDPERLDDYLHKDGYQALAKVLISMKAEEVIDLITKSGLRGRGGGGFPTGKKWSFAAGVESVEKFVVCNADEGDPGAFMNRAVLEGDPHAVLEGMAIAGYAIGSHRGVIYIRAEYPLAVKRLFVAIDQAKKAGLLGKDLFGSGFDFEIDIKYGAGAFVCGEETALLHSVEGCRGEPTLKPPFPAVAGLWKRPTVVNNVETLANVPTIIRRGATWFRGFGTPNAPGTKVFALAGKVNKVGLVEVPMGMTLRQIIYGIGEGIKGGRKLKAVQTGGPSGGCIREDEFDTPIDYDTLRSLGSMMGSGGMIVMDEDDCMVNVAKFFLEFTLDESCGKCTPCRIGNKRLFEMLEKICEGKGTPDTLLRLESLSATIKDTSLCGLGQTSPNPVLATMRKFPEEYREHVHDRRCRAGVCTALVRYVINDRCVGCTLCARNCPVSCIAGERKKRHVIDESKCVRCGVCFEKCKFHAIDRA
jgi:NADH:ubiquinone oxidoreductase subunit F (NADH-binding)/NAD-dependent dihydropyrimidine dehydrogenase PreA subunit/(2Fe-2S) ferredoxin